MAQADSTRGPERAWEVNISPRRRGVGEFLQGPDTRTRFILPIRDIRGLVVGGLLHDAVEYQFGLSKLLSAADVQRFAESYVAISALAKRSHVHTVSLVRYLKESGTPPLTIALPEKGCRHAFSLSRDVAAHIQIPSRRLLREHAQRRIVADRKKQWEEYRQAREAALGKPMRRVRRTAEQFWAAKDPLRSVVQIPEPVSVSSRSEAPDAVIRRRSLVRI